MKSTYWAFGALLMLWWFIPAEVPVAPETPLTEVYEKLGAELPNQPNWDLPGVSAEAGKALVLEGKTIGPNGRVTSRQSKHYVCTSCHNVKREDPDLTVSDPQARLMYVQGKGLPFLQGTTLYGAVNRTSFYNGDYEKKYGDLVKPARNSIRESIQLCAVECSQGRALKDWELESVLAYLWTIGLKVGDLDLSEDEMAQVDAAVNGNGDKEQATSLLQSKYLKGAPASFVDPPADRKAGYPEIVGNPDNGKVLYDLSCLHCHEGQRYSFFNLDGSVYSFRFLKKHFDRYTRYSVYQVSRYGTSPMAGKKTYMPNYTLEKMSHQQMEDLKAYIYQMAD
jgi:mono/diheme cytochrome c family protein